MCKGKGGRDPTTFSGICKLLSLIGKKGKAVSDGAGGVGRDQGTEALDGRLYSEGTRVKESRNKWICLAAICTWWWEVIQEARS